jgi:large subunit ribosomal protein L3
MAKASKPKAGSRAFWPRKRAARIYPRLKAPPSDKARPLGFAAYKAGMVRAEFTDTGSGSPTPGEDVVTPVTVLESPPLAVAGVVLLRLGAYGWTEVKRVMAEKLSKDLARKTATPKKPSPPGLQEMEKIVSAEGAQKRYDVRLLVHTQPKGAAGKKKPEVFELSLGGKLGDKLNYAKEKLGGEIKAGEVFSEGEFIDVSAVTTGKGYQGPVKRFGVKIRPRKHEKKRRHVGNIGAVTPGRVLPGKIAMAGQHGFQTRTEYNKFILRIADAKEKPATPKGGFLNYGEVRGPHMILKGSVPGPKKRLIMLKKAQRPPARPEKIEVKELFLESQQ